MKRKITTILIAMMFTSRAHIIAQSGQITGTSTVAGDLYQENKDLGVGSTADPAARIHIFNKEVDLTSSTQPLLRMTLRPFLITGKIIQIPDGSAYFPDTCLFTVDKKGFVGINVLNPNSKLSIFGLNSQGWNSGIELNRQDGGKAVTIVDAQGLKFRTMTEGSGFYFINHSDIANVVIKENGYVGIGIETPEEKLHVKGNERIDGNSEINGNITINDGSLLITGNNVSSVGINEILLGADGYIRAREIKVDLQTIPDYVFKEGYNLMPLEELKIFVEKNKHLPNVKSEADFNAEGSISLTEMNMKLLEKVEELTLYILDLQSQIDNIKNK